MSALRVAVVGCTGRMGATLLRAIAGDPDLQLVGAVSVPTDPRIGQDAGRAVGLEPLHVLIGAAVPLPCDAVLEFTAPAGCVAWADWCAEHGVPLVSGTTGLNDAQQARLHAAARRIPLVWAPNMSVGVNVLLAIVRDLARRLDASWDIEIVEAHHRRKIDAPSGTARALLEALSAGRGQRSADVAVYGRAGDCGPRPSGQIGVHAVRMGALVGEHEVHFTSDAEALTIRHRAFARDTFAAGALRAARWVQGRAPGLYDMQAVLFS